MDTFVSDNVEVLIGAILVVTLVIREVVSIMRLNKTIAELLRSNRATGEKVEELHKWLMPQLKEAIDDLSDNIEKQTGAIDKQSRVTTQILAEISARK